MDCAADFPFFGNSTDESSAMAQRESQPGASLDLVVHTLHCNRHAMECYNLFGVAVEFEVTVEIVGESLGALRIGLIVASTKHDVIDDDGTSIVN